MQPYQVCSVFFLLLFSFQFTAAKWLKMYEEDYHRPTYYNKAHKSDMHVPYNRKRLEQRDVTTKRPRNASSKFDPRTDNSYYVNVLHLSSVICAGALISRRMVITSTRCFQPDLIDPTREFKAEDMSVISGKDFASSANKALDVIAFFMPAARNISRGVHDIALLALSKKLQRGEYHYLPLYSRLPKLDSTVTMSFVDHQTHDITLYDTKVLNFEKCMQSYEDFAAVQIPFDDEFFCVTNRGKAGCSTRPGDPLIVDNKLAGINIYGEHCINLEGGHRADIYYAVRHSVKYIQRATDLLRAFTGSGPFNDSMTTVRVHLYQVHTTIPSYLNYD